MPAIALKNPLTIRAQAELNDPYPLYSRLRAAEPVWWCGASKVWIVSTYAEAQLILRSSDFEKQIQRWKHSPNPKWALFFPPFKALRETSSSWLLNLNPPDHTRVRSLVGRTFAPSTVNRLKPEIEKTAVELINIAKEKGEFDLVADYAFPLPLTVIALIMGIPVSDRELLKKWSNMLVSIAGGNRSFPSVWTSGSAIIELRRYLTPLIEERRKDLRDDMLSMLISAEEEGSRLNTAELLSNLILFLVAGQETTVNLISNAVLNLTRNPEQLAKLIENPQLVTSAVQEVLRYDGPAQAVPRLANKDVVVGSKTIKAGDMVWILLGSANRDDKEFKDAHVFDITRAHNRHISFSEGIHRCIGASLAEAECEIALTSLFSNFPNLKMVDQQVDFKFPLALRGPKHLMVTA
jgi:cytochrome P450